MTKRPFIKNGAAALALAGLLWLAGTGAARAHAFLERAEPGVGGSVKAAPGEVSIRFTEAVEPGVSQVQVFDAAGKQVDKKNLRADPKDAHRLLVSLPAGLGVGTYRVVWRAVSVDTHVTKGDFTFRVEP